MLVRFVVSNFLSFNEEMEFSMIAGSNRTHRHHVYNAGKTDVLKASALYGANGAGKSNLVKAFSFLHEMVLEGEIHEYVNNKKFKLSSKNTSKPVFFEIEVSIDKILYIYGISIDNDLVNHEYLFESGVTVDDKLIFERKTSSKGNTSIKVAAKFSKTKKDKLLIELMEEKLLHSHELFLGKSDEVNFEEITKVRNHIVENFLILDPYSRFQNLVDLITKSNYFKKFANDILQSFDTGINELEIESIDLAKYFGEEEEDLKKEVINLIESGKYVVYPTFAGGVLISKEKNKYIVKKVVAKHVSNEGKNVFFDLLEESDGTQRLIDFIPAFDNILRNEFTLIIDEIDRSIHPALLKTLIEKIMSAKNTKGQLIFTTHESNLLDLRIFRQDEIWFVEKNKKSSSTQLYSLNEYKPRYDLDIRKGYLAGRFGAIPFLADLEDLNWLTYDTEEERV